MSAIPSLIIVTDRGHLNAYRVTESNSLEKIDSAQFAEGNQKISDRVSDQSGSFRVGGSAESMPMIAELEVRCFRQIAEKIREIVDREKPKSWGFATPSEINGAILDGIGEKYHGKLAINLRVDITNEKPADIFARFNRATAQS